MKYDLLRGSFALMWYLIGSVDAGIVNWSDPSFVKEEMLTFLPPGIAYDEKDSKKIPESFLQSGFCDIKINVYIDIKIYSNELPVTKLLSR